MTLNQTLTIAAYTGIVMLVRDDKDAYHRYVEELIGRPLTNNEITSMSNEISKRAKISFDKHYQYFNKNELAVIQSYTGAELLKKEDAFYLDALNNASDDDIRISFLKLCLPKSKKPDVIETPAESVGDRIAGIVEDILMGLMVLTLAFILIMFAICIKDLIVVGEMQDTRLGILLTSIVVLVILVIIYAISPKPKN
jgi:hypothetical protein